MALFETEVPPTISYRQNFLLILQTAFYDQKCFGRYFKDKSSAEVLLHTKDSLIWSSIDRRLLQSEGDFLQTDFLQTLLCIHRTFEGLSMTGKLRRVVISKENLKQKTTLRFSKDRYLRKTIMKYSIFRTPLWASIQKSLFGDFLSLRATRVLYAQKSS